MYTTEASPLLTMISKDKENAHQVSTVPTDSQHLEQAIREVYLSHLIETKNIPRFRILLQTFKTVDLKAKYPQFGHDIVNGYIQALLDLGQTDNAIHVFKSEIASQKALSTEVLVDINIVNTILARLVASDSKYATYEKSHGLVRARKLYEFIISSNDIVIVPTITTMNIILDGYAKRSELDRAMNFYKEELLDAQNLQPNTQTFEILTLAHTKSLHFQLEERDKKLVASSLDQFMSNYETWLKQELKIKHVQMSNKMYNLMIRGYARVGDLTSVNRLLDEMKQEKMQANIFTLNSVLEGLTSATRIQGMIINDVKRGIMEMVMNVFRVMSETIPPNGTTYRFIVSGYLRRKMMDEAMDFLYKYVMDKKANLRVDDQKRILQLLMRAAVDDPQRRERLQEIVSTIRE
jgi:pentatricopeptide repeat protein